MQVPVQITFKDVPPSAEIEEACNAEASKLERYYDRITSCRVQVLRPHRKHEQGNLYEVHVDVTLPGKEIATSRVPSAHHANEDPLLAVREAFQKTRRQLEDFVRKQRGA